MNTAFHLYEAADICIREVERRLPLIGSDIHFKTKQKFNNISETVKRLEYLVESFLDEYNGAYDDKTIADRTENIRRIASWYARLALLIGDRCDCGDGTKEQHIMQFVDNMPAQGNIEEKTLTRLTLK